MKRHKERRIGDPAETTRIRRIYEREAPRFDRQMAVWDKLLFGVERSRIATDARGDVLEVGVGTGRNLAHYDPTLRLTAIELSSAMLEIASHKLDQLAIGSRCRLLLADAQALPFQREAFDTVVITLSLCTIPDDRRAVREARRVLRRGGRLLLLEHVRSTLRLVRVVQRLLEPITLRLDGDHLTRDPLDYLAEEGIDLVEVERSKWGIVERVVAQKRAASGNGAADSE